MKFVKMAVLRFKPLNVSAAEKALDELIIPFSRARLLSGKATIYEVVSRLGQDDRAESFLRRYGELEFAYRLRPIGLWT